MLKRAEIDSAARESYSSSPPLEDCILPLVLPESILEREIGKKMCKSLEREREGEKDRDVEMGSERFALLITYTHNRVIYM